MYQHREGTKLYNPALIQGDISVEQPTGTHRGTEGELSNPIKAWNLRFDNAEWDPNYRFVNRGSSQWVAEFRRTGIYRVDNPYRMAIIVAESNDPDTGRAMGIYYPKSEINNYPITGVVEATGEIAYKDPRTNLLKAVEDRTVVRGAMTKIGFTTRIRGMISRDRLPQGVYETWREEYFIFYGTPRQIMDAIEAYEADKQHQVITFPLLQQVSPGSGQLTLAATASSGLPVSYTSSNPEVAIVTGNRIQIVGSGETTITASQYGNRDTAMAPDVSRALVVSDGPDWAGYAVRDMQYVDTAGWLGWLNVFTAPFIYSESLSQWLYINEAQVTEAGAWAYFFNF